MPFLGTTPTQGFVSSFPKQSFTPNGSTTVFTLTNPVATANDLEVFVGNVRQEPTTAYTAAGTTLTMSEAPASGLNFYVINKSFAQVTTNTPDNSVSTAKIVNDAVTAAKLGAGAVDTTALGANAVTSAKLFSTFKNGIESADMWRMTTDTTTADNRSTGIFTDWQRVYQINGMSEANGVFTFPSTGIYEIELAVRFLTNGTSARHLGGGMLVSTDSGSNYSNSSLMDDVTSHMGHVTSNTYQACFATTFFDVTNTSTQRIKFFGRSSDSSNLVVQGTANLNYTWVRFVRLGDT